MPRATRLREHETTKTASKSSKSSHTSTPQDTELVYLKGLPDEFIAMADIQLRVQEKCLPAHKALLAANSKVLGKLFSSEYDAAVGSNAAVPEIPLPGEKLTDVSLVLTYIYERVTFKSQMEPIRSIDDAEALARFAHKCDIVHMLNASEKYLIERVSCNDPELQAEDGRQPLVALTNLAEQCGLQNLLAHCEVLLVQQDDRSLWTPETVSVGQLSQASLLRMLRAYHSVSLSKGFTALIPLQILWTYRFTNIHDCKQPRFLCQCC